MTVQKRIYELLGYEYDPSISEEDIYVALDSTYFDKAKKIPMTELIGDTHIEKDSIPNLGSSSISITFGTAISSTPQGYAKAYRWTEIRTGIWRKSDVLGGFSSIPNATGFSYEIDASESLTGVIFEYFYQ